jgi:hypothetical protein
MPARGTRRPTRVVYMAKKKSALRQWQRRRQRVNIVEKHIQAVFCEMGEYCGRVVACSTK